jgi:hypothetical protein
LSLQGLIYFSNLFFFDFLRLKVFQGNWKNLDSIKTHQRWRLCEIGPSVCRRTAGSCSGHYFFTKKLSPCYFRTKVMLAKKTSIGRSLVLWPREKVQLFQFGGCKLRLFSWFQFCRRACDGCERTRAVVDKPYVHTCMQCAPIKTSPKCFFNGAG